MNNDKIAIIGISVNFPGANNIDEFWRNLCGKVDSAGAFPIQRRKNLEGYMKNCGLENREFKNGAYLKDISGFDYKYFKIPKVEALAMSPHQRLFLESAVSALEDAGYGGERLCSKNIGVYVGNIGDNDLITYQNILEASTDENTSTGALSANITGRLSYLMDFRGPSMLLDSACSSSLAALNAACQGIRADDCEAAIVGAVQLSIFPDIEIELGIESADGHTRPFDQFSEGTGAGEGVASLVIKPYEKAKRDRDHIYCVIKSLVGNQDGRSVGLSAPNPQAQTDLIKKSLKEAGVEAGDIDYLELHGTGTKVGDPIEFRALQQALAGRDHDYKCDIGSVKANIGHLFACSGLAGIVKCCLMLHHQKLTPQINLSELNHQINLKGSAFQINTEMKPWGNGSKKLLCGVSNFGFSGTNYHVLLEGEEFVPKQPTKENEIFILSAMSKESLERIIKKYFRVLSLNNTIDLSDICYTVSTGRGHYKYRLAIICASVEELKDKLKEFDFCSEFGNGIYYHAVNKILDNRITPRFGDLTRAEAKKLNSRMEDIMIQIKASGSRELYDRLCMAYINGGESTWDQLYSNREVKRISLPTYSFDKTECWPAFES